jgi:hypothetical protein
MKCVNSGCEWRNRHFLHCHERPLIANKGTGETDETDIVTAADTRQEWKQSEKKPVQAAAQDNGENHTLGRMPDLAL